MNQYFRPGIDIDGRPDWKDHKFGKTKAKRHKRFVYSNIDRTSPSKVHRVAAVRFSWYDAHGDWLERLDHPKIMVDCLCGYFFFLGPDKVSGILCNRPPAGYPRCPACEGRVRFGKLVS